MGLPFLRVLDLENVRYKSKELPKGIGKLIHLRYLNLRNSGLTTLPWSLGKLTLLLTLDLRQDEGWKISIPDVICKMENLIHLYLPQGIEYSMSRKIELGSLINLETLVNFEIGFMDVKDLLKMVNLKRLTLLYSGKGNRIKKKLIIFNGALKNVRYVEVPYFESSELVDGFITQMVSACTNLDILRVHAVVLITNTAKFSETITAMEFSSCSFEEDRMPIFERLPKLKYLKMDGVTIRGKRGLVWSTGGFPELRYLYLLSLDQLEEWRVEEGAMPNLHHLSIERCRDLKMLPDGLRLIETLKELNIVDMPKEFEDRSKEGGEDFHKIQHIPNIQIIQTFWQIYKSFKRIASQIGRI